MEITGPKPTIKRARRLRRALSLPEVLLWQRLRQRPGGFKFRRQHPAGPYVLDFYCDALRLAVEVDGEGHDRGSRPERDERRDDWLAGIGVRVIRVPAKDILGNADQVVEALIRLCGALPLHQDALRLGPPPPVGEDLA